MKETFYIFKLDSQNRILIPVNARTIYGFEDIVYFKLQQIEGENYLEMSGYTLKLYQSMARIDDKGRIFLPKEVREKFELKPKDTLVSYEGKDEEHRSLLLRKVRR